MSDELLRVSGLLETANQHMQRFHDLEQIEWKINFSVWALLGGLAYLWAAGKNVITPELLRSPRAPFLVPLLPMAVHGSALFMLNRQQREVASRCKDARYLANQLLRLESAKGPTEKKYLFNIRWRDVRWIVWNLLVTFMITAAVILLVQASSR
jgi:hypothetical protein